MSIRKSPKKSSISSKPAKKRERPTKKRPAKKPTPSPARKPTPKAKKPVKPTRPARPAKPTRPTTTTQRRKPGARRTTTRAAGVTAGAAGAAAVARALSAETQATLGRLQNKFGDLQESMLLTRVQTEMADVETALSLLPTEVERLRTRGYVFRSFLENKIGVLAEQWDEMKDRVADEVERRTRDLERDSDTAERALNQALGGSASRVSRAESAIDTLESKVRAAQSAVEAMYEPLQQNVNQTRFQIEEIRELLDQIDEASFQLHPVEDVVAFCKAQYIEREDEGPEGLLYLTDERLIFERKEEVATKKVLFITTEKETVQELIFEVPIGQIEEIKASDKKKFLGRKEMLELFFAPEADLSGATLRLIGAENEEWTRLIGRVKSGEIEKERTRPKDEEAVEAARVAPTKCATCGATISVEIVRGMREITCEYCGSVIRL
jgi:predicted  nucleic acid-binding Zn-ribbon protein